MKSRHVMRFYLKVRNQTPSQRNETFHAREVLPLALFDLLEFL